MTRLHRTPLTLLEKIDCAARVVATLDKHGTISELSREFRISRPTLYEARDAASSVLEAHFKQTQGNPVYVLVDEAQLQRAIVVMRTTSPTSITGLILADNILKLKLPPLLHASRHISMRTL